MYKGWVLKESAVKACTRVSTKAFIQKNFNRWVPVVFAASYAIIDDNSCETVGVRIERPCPAQSFTIVVPKSDVTIYYEKWFRRGISLSLFVQYRRLVAKYYRSIGSVKAAEVIEKELCG